MLVATALTLVAIALSVLTTALTLVYSYLVLGNCTWKEKGAIAF